MLAAALKKITWAVFSIGITLTSTLNAYPLPNLGDPSRNLMSQAEEKVMGKKVMAFVYSSLPVTEDPVINEYIRTLGQQLVNGSRAVDTEFDFFAINSPIINAFTLPGHHIGVFSGLILATETDSQLAAVMTHEIAHANQHHLARQAQQARTANIESVAILLAAIAVGAKLGSSDIAMAGTSAAMATRTGSLLTYSRQFEQEADRLGIHTLYEAGYNPNAMPQFFARMERLTLNYDNSLYAFANTHPITESRIADAQERVARLKPIHHASTQRYYLIKARLYALTHNRNVHDIHYFKEATANSANEHEKLAMQYGLALTYDKMHRYEEAKHILRPMIKAHPNEPLFTMALADILGEEHHPRHALKLLTPLRERFPHYTPLAALTAETELLAHEPNKARLILKNLTTEEPDDLYLLNALINAQAKSKHYVGAYRTRASVFAHFLDKKMAELQLQQALKEKQITALQKIEIQQQLKAIQNLPSAK